MVLTQIFSVASIILGIYLIFAYFNNKKSQPFQPIINQQYHLGCFLNNHNFNESKAIANSIQAINEQIRNNISLNMYHTDMKVPDDFNRRSVQLAFDFQTFIEQQLKTKMEMKNYVSLSKAVNKAHAEYLQCSITLKNENNLNEVECLEDWDAYQSCIGDLQIQKQKLNLAFRDKNTIVEDMQKLLSEKGSPDIKKDSTTMQYEKQYKSRIRLLEQREKRLEIDIKSLDEKISTKEYFISTLLNDSKHAQELYYECHENRKQFKLCEEISKEVRTLGYGQIEKLDQWLKNKFKTLTRLQKMIEEGGSGANVDQLKKLFKKGTAQYEEMLKLFIETKVKMNKHCGCSEDEENKLKENAAMKKKEAEEKKKEIIELNYKLNRLSLQLNQLTAEKEKQFNAYRDKISSIPKREDKKEDKLKMLDILSEEKKKTAEGILKFEYEFNDIEAKCKIYRQRLDKKIKIIERIKECAGKKYYFQRLVERLKKENPQGIEKERKLRQILREQLEGYTV